jgi:hypothetical protein
MIASASAALGRGDGEDEDYERLPAEFPQYAPNATKWMAAPWNISSEHKNMTMRFRRHMNPIMPIANISPRRSSSAAGQWLEDRGHGSNTNNQ